MRRLSGELGVLAALLAAFLTIALPLPHRATATVWMILTAIHLARRRRIYAALLRWSAPGRRRRPVATTALIACAAVVMLSGFAQWAGSTAAILWHASSSALLIGLAATHATHRLWRAQRHTRHIVAHRRELGTTDVSTPQKVGTVEFTTLAHPRRGTRVADCRGGYRGHESCGGSG